LSATGASKNDRASRWASNTMVREVVSGAGGGRAGLCVSTVAVPVALLAVAGCSGGAANTTREGQGGQRLVGVRQRAICRRCGGCARIRWWCTRRIPRCISLLGAGYRLDTRRKCGPARLRRPVRTLA